MRILRDASEEEMVLAFLTVSLYNLLQFFQTHGGIVSK